MKAVLQKLKGRWKTTTLIVLIGLLLLSSIAMAITGIVGYFNQKENKPRAADLTISDLAGLQAFANAVNSGTTYEGKVVELSNSINCEGTEIVIGSMKDDSKIFKGRFNGNNRTISNFILPGDSNGEIYIGDGTAASNINNYQTYGLFRKISSSTTIENLRIKDVSDFFSFVGRVKKNVGVIVGYSVGGTIRNCAVENVTFSANGSGGTLTLAGIFSAGYATVTDCAIKNLTTDVTYTRVVGIGPAEPPVLTYYQNNTHGGWYARRFVFDENPSNLSSCVAAGVKNNGTTTDIALTSYTVPGGGSTTSQNYGHTISYCYATKNNTEGLDVSSEGGSTGKIWYYGGDDYNGGYPYLRKFISWNQVSIQPTEGMGKVNDSEDGVDVYVPKEAHDAFLRAFTSNSTSPTITALNKTFYAENNEGYVFSEWVQSLYSFIWARFDYQPFNVTFNSPTTGITVTGAGTYSVTIATTVTVTKTAWEGNSSAWRVIKYSFVDTGGTAREITYTANSAYYLTTDFEGTKFTMGKTTINVTANVKLYKPTFTPIEE